MRARGAQITDIVVLIISADDSALLQTKEAIEHAQSAKVPIIVAVNKIDKENADPDKVIGDLAQHNIVPEEWGGDTICVKISALNGQGIDELDAISLQAEIMELKASSTGSATGTVVESSLDKGRGPVATVLVQNGLLSKKITFWLEKSLVMEQCMMKITKKFFCRPRYNCHNRTIWYTQCGR